MPRHLNVCLIDNNNGMVANSSNSFGIVDCCFFDGGTLLPSICKAFL